MSPDWDYLYFAPNAVPANRIAFTSYDGSRSWVAPTGERQVRLRNGNVERFRHHLAVSFRPEFFRYGVPVVQLRLRLFLSDLGGHQLAGRKVTPRRKRVTRDWWNHQWLMRQFAALSWIADGQAAIVLTRSLLPPVSVSATPIQLDAAVGIDERTLAPAIADDDSEVIDEEDLTTSSPTEPSDV
jgi:hypothetical protein